MKLLIALQRGHQKRVTTDFEIPLHGLNKEDVKDQMLEIIDLVYDEYGDEIDGDPNQEEFLTV